MSRRKDLRTSESEWRGMSSAHRSHTKPLPKKQRSLKLTTFIKWAAIVVSLIAIGSTLHSMQAKCEQKLSDSIYCVD